MALQGYKDSGLLFNSNFLESTSEPGVSGYRGELVLVEGEVADAKGHHKPAVEVMRGVVMLADDKLKMVVGAIDRLEFLSAFVDKYQADFAPDLLAVLYVVDIADPMRVEAGGVDFVLIPLDQGVPWNEIIDELALEKSDFKGQSAANKVLTLCHELQGYKPTYLRATLDEALAATTGAVREAFGAV